ncbi:MAG: hypothetical protein ISR48_10950 [Alphaproteobacteria bacterium]|nr:hypothetical protein [Alphaproteobacteria bacterium]
MTKDNVMNEDSGMDALHKRQRSRNLALGGVLLALVALFYLITIVRMGGQS